MKNYKIVENRPELTKEQIENGMNFDIIKNNIPVPKKLFLKPIVIAGFTGLVTVASLILIHKYNNHNNSNPQKEQRLPTDTIHSSADSSKKPITNNKSNLNIEPSINAITIEQNLTYNERRSGKNSQIDTSSHNIELRNKESRETNDSSSEKKKEKIDADTVSSKVNRQESSKEPKPSLKTHLNYSCTILKSGNYCVFPDSFHLPYTWHCDNCEFIYSSCKDIDKSGKAIGIWLRVKIKRVSSFELKSHFENITLVKANGKKEHPFAISFDMGENKESTSRYLLSSFKAKKIIWYYRESIDFILLFNDAEVGDKIIIDKLIEAEIQN